MRTRLRAYVAGLLHRNKIDSEVDEELRFHVEMETQANIERGMTPQEASRVALRDLGGVTQTREAVRDVRAVWLDAAVRDLRHAFRSLARTPWYFAAAVGVIALAMALTTAVLAVVDGMLFKALPYRQPDRLFAVSASFSKLSTEADTGPLRWKVSPLELNAWREAVPSVEFTAFSEGYYDTDTLELGSHPAVDARFFETLGVALKGTGFGADDFVTARSPIAPIVISHAVWRNHYALDPSAIGRTFLDSYGTTRRIVGVLPPDFVLPSGPWVLESMRPLVINDPASTKRELTVLARLPGDVTPAQVAERLTVATRRISARWPSVPANPEMLERIRIARGPFDTVRLDPLRTALASQAAVTGAVVFWAAVALMLLACLNVAGLAVARVQDRHRDLVVRRALGARYVDLVRLLALENVVVATCGTALGVWGARMLLDATTGLMPRSLQFLKPPVVDARVVVFSALASALSVLLITLLPARVVWRQSLQGWLAGGPSVTPRLRRSGSIVSVQVALATVMAVGAALVAGSLVRVWGEDPGFDFSRVADLTVSIRKAAPGTSQELASAIGRMPGVRAAGGTNHPLAERSFNGNSFERPAGALPATSDAARAGLRPRDPSDVIEEVGVTSGYFDAIGLRPIDGRVFTETECALGAPVVVVSDRVAREYWPGKRAVGQTLTKEKGGTVTVVGVVPDAKYLSLDRNTQPAIYRTEPRYVYHLVAAFDRSGRATVHDVLAMFKKQCPTCTVYKAQMLSDTLGASIKPRRFNAWLFSSFGIAALFIVGAGILGLVAMTTGRRTQEIGIRMALGSTRAGVVRQILREQVVSVFVGLLAGGVAAAWLVTYVKSYLYKTPLYDGWSWGAATVLIVGIALVGALIPSLRATRIDPIRALRVE